MGSDEKGLGRWCYIRLSGKYNKHFWIIATYRVCNQGSEGLETAYMQQVRILSRQGKTKPDPQKQWTEDLLHFIKTIPKDGEILVVGDMNGNLEDKELGHFLAESELYDLMTATHNANTPPTYIRGNKTIDHMFGTAGILNAVENIGVAFSTRYNKGKPGKYS
eukprot:11027408-Ditylum_brightwellii.AAC.1